MDEKKFELLSAYVDAIIKKDDNAAKESFLPFAQATGQEIVKAIRESAKGTTEDSATDKDDKDMDDADDEDTSKYLKNRAKKKSPLKKMKKMDEAAILKEFHGEDSPVKLKGDDVYVEGKMVGTITNDLSDWKSGIVFTSTDGSFKQEFDDIQSLYAFLVDKFNISTETPLDSDEI